LEGCPGPRAAPSPTLPARGHKRRVDRGRPARLATPATDFASIFDKTGCGGIKGVLDRCEADCPKGATAQTPRLGGRPGPLSVGKEGVAAMSTRAEKTCPPIRLSVAGEATGHLTRGGVSDGRAKRESRGV